MAGGSGNPGGDVESPISSQITHESSLTATNTSNTRSPNTNASAPTSIIKRCLIFCAANPPFDKVVKFLLFVGFTVFVPVNATVFLVYSFISINKVWGTKLKLGRYNSLSDLEFKIIYQKVYEYTFVDSTILGLRVVTTTRLGFLALLWLVVNLRVPSLTRVTLFGSLLSEWSLLATLLLLGYPWTLLACRQLCRAASILDELIGIGDKMFFMWELKYDVATLLYFAWILTVWKLYFLKDQGLNPKPGSFYGTWILVSLLVGAFLKVLKGLVLSQWKANAIYNRFKTRILIAGFQLFFYFVIMFDLKDYHLLPWRYQKLSAAWKYLEKCVEPKKIADNDRRSIRDSMLGRHVDLMQTFFIAQRVVGLAETTLRDDDATSKIVSKCRQRIQSSNGSGSFITEQFLTEKFYRLETEDARLLLKEVGAKHDQVEVTFEAFGEWMVDAHKNGLLLGYTLNDALATVSTLNVVLNCCIVILVILFWFVATGLAATNVLVTIGSIFVGLSFMFVDTCKAFCQGVIFSFVTHPFDVGDRCIIDGVEVEVQKIGILTTTCLKVGTEEKMLYPNANLSTKLIINLGARPDPTDLIELVLDSCTSSAQIESLRKRIEGLSDGNAQHFHKDYEVMVEMGSSIKMSIRFKHILNVDDVSHSKCFMKKNRQRYEFFIGAKKLLEELGIKAGTQ